VPRERSFRFVQLDVPGRVGIDDGRYLVRSDDGERTDAVVVVQTLGAPAPRAPRRRRRPRRAEPVSEPAEIPLSRLTAIPADGIRDDEATAELERLGADPDAAEAAVAAGLRTVNRVLRAHRLVTLDPHGNEISRERALAARVGYGTGDGLADGRWEEALDVPPPERRRRRVEALRPQERLAAVLAGRERFDACETLLLRARADLDQGFTREAALQLGLGLAALLAELPGRAGPDQEEDLAELEARRAATERDAEDALRGDLPAARSEELEATLEICERVLRRRRILGGESPS
jgi:hypothetical protein